MGKSRTSVAVIGEGITEKYYIESLRGLAQFQVLPQELGRKASSLNALEKAIKDAVAMGYDKVYCLIDMDTKAEGDSRLKYMAFKQKYHRKTFGKKKEGTQTEVIFIENQRCMEVWFLYHFEYTTREFTSYGQVEESLHRYIPDYKKNEQFFRKVPGGLHNYLIKNGGNLTEAIENAKKSCKHHEEWTGGEAFSEMHEFMADILPKQ